MASDTRSSREFSHYVVWDARGGRFVRALCGVLIARTGHVAEPTCPVCSAVLKVDAVELDALRAEPVDPDLAIPYVPYNPCAGYKPRGSR